MKKKTLIQLLTDLKYVPTIIEHPHIKYEGVKTISVSIKGYTILGENFIYKVSNDPHTLELLIKELKKSPEFTKKTEPRMYTCNRQGVYKYVNMNTNFYY